jgi:translation elongation factor EF-1beta
MPRASELEEFGLEVESEHHALMQQTSNSRQPLELASPTKRQVKLLQSTNTKRFRPGMLKWALLVFALAVIVFLNIGQEGKIETELLEGEESAEEQEAKALNEHKGDWAEDKGEYRVFGDEGKKDNLHIEEEAEETILEHHGGIQVPVGNVPPHKGFTNADAEKAKAEAAAKAKAEVASTEEANSSETETSGNSEAAETTSTTEMPITEKPKNTPVSKPLSSGNNNSGGKFTQKRLLATRAAAQDLIKLLEDYYYGSETMSKMLIKSWVGPWDFEANVDEMDEMVQKMVDTMIRALVTEDQTEFIIGTIGSSVAAGHDNCNYDSYENQLQRTLGPVWEAAGMNLVCQNAGEGGGCGDNFANQVFCIKQNVSPKIDIAHYTWSYFEVGDHDGALVSRENLIRWTQMMPKQPPVHVINVEGSVEVAWDEKDLQKHYAKYGYNAFYMRYAYRQGGYDYDTEAKNGIDRFGWGYVGDGYHNTTRYGELEEDEGRRDSLGVLLRNWHPGEFACIKFLLILTATNVVLLLL